MARTWKRSGSSVPPTSAPYSEETQKDLHEFAQFIENECGPIDDLLEDLMPGLGEVDFLTP